MNKKKISLLSLLLTTAMLLSVFQTSVFAFTHPVEKDVDETISSGYSEESDTYEIYPVVQRMVTLDSGTHFQLGKSVNIVFEENIDKYTKDFLKEVLSTYGITYTESGAAATGKFNIYVGINGSGGAADNYIKSFNKASVTTSDLFTKNDAYVLTAVDGAIAIVGRDTDAAFRGISTLQMMFSSFAGEYFIPVFIEDYSLLEYRGFIEGMYAIWDYAGRESLMRFARDVKMNIYVYASKSDPYHTSRCTDLYPDTEIKKIQELVEVGKETKCYYGWSFHLSGFLTSDITSATSDAYKTKFEKLCRKIDQLYNVGVRKFDVLNDDFGSSNYSLVVSALNDINKYIKSKEGCGPITYCPVGYNKAWSSAAERAIFPNIDSDIIMYWTGDDVNAPMTQESINYAKDATKHDICTWLNYPVNEHGQSGIYLGDITHYARDGVTGQRGALSNPCLYPEASKVALFQLACLWWNNKNYSSIANEVWEDSFEYLQPEAYDAYYTLAHNISNCPGSGRVSSGYNESEYLTDVIKNVQEKITTGADISNDKDAQYLLEEFIHIRESVDTFRENCENTSLVTELSAWLDSISDVAEAGRYALEAVCALEDDDISAAWDAFSTAALRLSTWDTHKYSNGQGSPQSAKAGSKRLVPFIQAVISELNSMITPALDPDNDSISVKFIGVVGGSDVSLNSEGQKAIDSNDSTYAHFQTVQKKDDYIGLDLGKVITVNDIRILLGQNDTHQDIIHDGVIEYSADNKTWTQIKTVTSSHLHEVSDLDIQARYIRLRVTGFNNPSNTSKLDYWLDVREISVNNANKKADSAALTNVESLKDSNIQSSTSSVTATIAKNTTFNVDDYFGVDLNNVYFYNEVKASITGMQGLTVEYSANGAVWKNESDMSSQDAVRYVRMINPVYSSGDLNSDGKLNIKDITLIQKHIAELIDTVDDSDADFDLNGKVNGQDVTLGQKILVGLSSFPAGYSTVSGTGSLNVTLEKEEFSPKMLENNLANQTLREGNWANVFDGNLESYAWTNTPQITGQYITFDLGASTPVYGVSLYFSDSVSKPHLYYAKIQISNDNKTWTDIKTLNNEYEKDYELNGAYRIIRCQASGDDARYIRIYITQNGVDQPYIRIHEIEVQTSTMSDPTIRSSLSGNLKNMIDGSLTTIYSSDAKTVAGDYISYILTDNVELSSFKVIQNNANLSKAAVSAVDLDGAEHKLGTLSGSVNSFDVSRYNGIQEIKLTFPAGETPEIYEITKQFKK